MVLAIYQWGGEWDVARPARIILFRVCCLRGTKTLIFAFARENSGVQPLKKVGVIPIAPWPPYISIVSTRAINSLW